MAEYTVFRRKIVTDPDTGKRTIIKGKDTGQKGTVVRTSPKKRTRISASGSQVPTVRQTVSNDGTINIEPKKDSEVNLELRKSDEALSRQRKENARVKKLNEQREQSETVTASLDVPLSGGRQDTTANAGRSATTDEGFNQFRQEVLNLNQQSWEQIEEKESKSKGFGNVGRVFGSIFTGKGVSIQVSPDSPAGRNPEKFEKTLLAYETALSKPFSTAGSLTLLANPAGFSNALRSLSSSGGVGAVAKGFSVGSVGVSGAGQATELISQQGLTAREANILRNPSVRSAERQVLTNLRKENSFQDLNVLLGRPSSFRDEARSQGLTTQEIKVLEKQRAITGARQFTELGVSGITGEALGRTLQPKVASYASRIGVRASNNFLRFNQAATRSAIATFPSGVFEGGIQTFRSQQLRNDYDYKQLGLQSVAGGATAGIIGGTVGGLSSVSRTSSAGFVEKSAEVLDAPQETIGNILSPVKESAGFRTITATPSVNPTDIITQVPGFFGRSKDVTGSIQPSPNLPSQPFTPTQQPILEPSVIPTISETPTIIPTPTVSQTPTNTVTNTITQSNTVTNTFSNTFTNTFTNTVTPSNFGVPFLPLSFGFVGTSKAKKRKKKGKRKKFNTASLIGLELGVGSKVNPKGFYTGLGIRR